MSLNATSAQEGSKLDVAETADKGSQGDTQGPGRADSWPSWQTRACAIFAATRQLSSARTWCSGLAALRSDNGAAARTRWLAADPRNRGSSKIWQELCTQLDDEARASCASSWQWHRMLKSEGRRGLELKELDRVASATQKPAGVAASAAGTAARGRREARPCASFGIKNPRWTDAIEGVLGQRRLIFSLRRASRGPLPSYEKHKQGYCQGAGEVFLGA